MKLTSPYTAIGSTIWSDALRLARAVAPIDPMWLEDPMPPAWSESWAKLTGGISCFPSLTGENLYKVEGFAPFHRQSGHSQG